MKIINQIIITAVIFLAIGLMIGQALGTYYTLKWVAEKAIYFFELEGNTLNIDAEELAGALGRYKNFIDGHYGTVLP